MYCEYRAAYKKLTRENRNIIRKMKYYLNSHHLNEISYDSLIEDIVGMALETQERGEDFSDTVGIEYKDFCDELIKNTLRKSYAEKILGALAWILAYVGLVVPFMYLFSLIIQMPEVFCKGVMLITPLELIYKYLIIVFALNIGWILIKRNVYKSPTIIFPLFLAIITIVVMFSDYITVLLWRQRQIIEVNVLIWTAVFAVSALLTVFIKRAVATHLAKLNHVA